MDYHIYLHSTGGGSTLQKPTQPSNNKKAQTKPTTKNFFQSAKDYVKQVSTFVDDTLKDLETAAESIVVVGIIKAAVEMVDFVYEKTESLYTTDTGNYFFADNIDKIKNRVAMVFNPIDSLLTVANANMQRRVSNRNAMAQRLLTGDTYLNYNYGQRGRKL
jgi:hypothetical protein